MANRCVSLDATWAHLPASWLSASDDALPAALWASMAPAGAASSRRRRHRNRLRVRVHVLGPIPISPACGVRVRAPDAGHVRVPARQRLTAPAAAAGAEEHHHHRRHHNGLYRFGGGGGGGGGRAGGDDDERLRLPDLGELGGDLIATISFFFP
uniref:Uncharacterized protein n=1 Tax=Oryza brachyantha TaxID=4533 RepID=J3KYT1_ORYBR